MKTIVKQLSVFFLTLFLSASLLLQLNIPVSAEETIPAESSTTEDSALTNEDTAAAGEIDHSTFSDEMLSAAIKRYQPPMLRNVDPYATDPHIILSGASLPYVGDAYVVALYVSFPNDTEHPENQKHPEGDDVDALEAVLTNLHDYYARASYGKLNILGEVIPYDAEKPRDEYASRDALLSEALQGLDEEYDFSNYDCNNDKMIDCIYLHIPYNKNDLWGSSWWSSCDICRNPDITADGVRLGSNVIVNRNVNDHLGLSTILHETGHAMGFPDYYSYDKMKTDDPEYPYLTGILTFDMMDTNIGDHNGFSKWIAGWLTEEDVTMVTANESGVTAMRGGKEVGIKNKDGSITLDLSSFNDTEDISKTGGIIVVGNDLRYAVFSDYYLLQYDTFAGNQQVYFTRDPDTPLSSGFRVYRVQAKLTGKTSGTMYHTNTTGKLHNKLIELVDPDYKITHLDYGYPYVRSTYEGDKYGCMYYAGDTLTPITDPSTNFQESLNAGYTGIYMEFLESEDTYGSVRIWYSDEARPEEKPLELELNTLEAVPGGYEIVITANQNLDLTQTAISRARARIDNKPYTRILNLAVDGNIISGKLYLDTDTLKKDSLLEISFPEDSFILPRGSKSQLVTVEVPVSPDLVDLTESASIPGSEDENGYGWHLSPVLRAEDGSYFFYSYHTWRFIDSVTVPTKYSFTSENPTEITVSVVNEGEEDYKIAESVINARVDNDFTEKQSLVPEGTQLGEFELICDAVKIEDYFYVASFTEMEGEEQPRFAISKLDANGALIKQVIPEVNGFVLDYSELELSRALIQAGPNNKLAVLLFNAIQNRAASGVLLNHGGTFFFDQDLNLEGRLDNYSTGCGTWLDDGRYISFTQRATNIPTEIEEEFFDRTNLLFYDITDTIDPPEEIQYVAESEDGDKALNWEPGSEDGLRINVDRSPENDAGTCQGHFMGVAVDGVELTEEKDYTVTFASVHITLLPSYLETLSEGTHTLTILFDDGQTDIAFMIQKRPSAPDSDTPSTGDGSQPLLWLILMALALCVTVGAITLSLRKKNR